MAEAKPSADQIAMDLAKLTEADLAGTLAILSGMLQSVRENNEKAIEPARFAADALRLELERWRVRKSNDDKLRELREAGKSAVKK